jgi:choline dehydrogenase-like flavoprotein
VTTNPAIWGETHFGLTAPTTISRISTCSRRKETGRSGSVSSTMSCCGWVFGWAALRPARSADSTRPGGLSAGAWQMRPLSRSYVEAKSNRPGDAPAINPRYLSEEADRRAIIGGLCLARRLFCRTGIAALRPQGNPARPSTSPDLRRIARLRAVLRRTCYHASCTCMMGFAPDERRRQRIARARARRAAGHRRLGDAGGHLDQHQRADNHDRRKGRRDDQRRRAAKIGCVAKAGGGGG